ncbi:MAG: hypothetical protein V4738_14405 [Pseudomonadota bacterium]
MKPGMIVATIIFIAACAALGTYVLRGAESVEQACAKKGGTLVRTYKGLVCAKVEVIGRIQSAEPEHNAKLGGAQ